MDTFQYKQTKTTKNNSITNGITPKEIKADDVEKELQKLEEENGNLNVQENTSKELDSIDEPVETINLEEENQPEIPENDDFDSTIYDESLCSVCNLSKLSMDCDLEKQELNHLLMFILNRIRSWVRTALQSHN